MGANDDFVMTIDDDEDIVIEEEAMDVSEPEEEQKKEPIDKKTAKKLRKQANRDQKKGIKPAAVEEQKKKQAAKKKEDDFDEEFTFSMDGGFGRAQNAWDFTAARGMLKGKQVQCDMWPYNKCMFSSILYNRAMLTELQLTISLPRRDKRPRN